MVYVYMYNVVLIFVSTVTTNGLQDLRYSKLQKEVSDLKELVLKINVELENTRKQCDEVRLELTTVRNQKQTMDRKEPVIYPKEGNNLTKMELNKRTAVAISSFNHWNSTTSNTTLFQCPNGCKGEKGEPGIPGPKGSTGATGAVGPKGDSGLTGARGQKGNIGMPGTTGQKGDSGLSGVRGPKGETGLRGPVGLKGEPGTFGKTGPQGPIGMKGSSGLNGIPGSKGETGHFGLPGQKGEPGNSFQTQTVAFYVISKTTVHHTHEIIVSAPALTNIGNDFDSFSGIFTCEVPGVYLFTWSLQVSHGQYVYSHLDVNGVPWSDLSVAGTNSFSNTGSQTIVVSLSRGETARIRLSSNDLAADTVTIHFTGVLLS